MRLDKDPNKSGPHHLKVFAPNGETLERKGWVALCSDERNSSRVRLALLTEDNEPLYLTTKVVITNTENGAVVYNPRKAPSVIFGRTLRTKELDRWLSDNPSWPAILELEDSPVEPQRGEGDGLNPTV